MPRTDAPERPAATRRPDAARVHRLGRGRVFWPDVLRRRLLALADVGAALAAAGTLAALGGARPALWAIAFVPGWLLLAKLHGLYDADHRSLRHLTVDELPHLGAWGVTGAAALAFFLIAAPAGPLEASWLLLVWATAVPAAFLLRAAARHLWRRLVPPARVLLVGDGPLARATRRKLELFPDMHATVAGVRPELAPADAEQALDGIDRVVVAAESLDERLIAALVAACRHANAKLSVVPPIRGMYGTAVRLGRVADLPVVEYGTWHVSRSTLFLKRVVDLALAAAALILLSPLLALLALAVLVADGRPVLFRQRRVGFRRRPFTMLKFRTMRDGEHGAVGAGSKPRADPRVTRLGRLLRRASLDELPQLFNVLRGDMAIVGPRPELTDRVDRYPEEYAVRLDVRPGLTGPMQVHGRGELTFEERLAVERDYVENLSLGRDLRILAMTFVAIVGGRGAY